MNNDVAIEPSEADRQQLTELQASLKELLEVQRDTEYLDLSEQSINSIEKELMPYIAEFENLKELNLEDNNIMALPDDLSAIFRNITIINLNGNSFEDYERTIASLKTIPNLKSLFINLHLEEQVDLVMRMLEDLEELNGLPVERDLIEGEGESDEDNESERNNGGDGKTQVNEKANNRYAKSPSN